MPSSQAVLELDAAKVCFRVSRKIRDCLDDRANVSVRCHGLVLFLFVKAIG